MSVAPAPVVEYIAPTLAVPLCCCKGQVEDEMKGGSFASKYHPVSNEVPRVGVGSSVFTQTRAGKAATSSTLFTSSQ